MPTCKARSASPSFFIIHSPLSSSVRCNLEVGKASMAESAELRYAVVTGANKGIGLETVKQLASHGVKVVLTARDEKRGLEAVDKLGELGLSDLVVFCQVDVADDASVASLADFIKTKFGKLDILVNNAGVLGLTVDVEAVKASKNADAQASVDWRQAVCETYHSAEECLQINYYGAKRTTEALLPLLQLSDAARIVNVSSSAGKLQSVKNAWAEGILGDVENLTEAQVDKVLSEFLNDIKGNSLSSKGWPTFMASYTLSKAALAAYTRILAKKYSNFCINCVCPGYVKTDINHHTGILTVEEGAASCVRLALLPNGDESGHFFVRHDVSTF